MIVSIEIFMMLDKFFKLNSNQNYHSPFVLLYHRDKYSYIINYFVFLIVLLFIGYFYSTYLGYPHIRKSIYSYVTTCRKNDKPVKDSQSRLNRISRIVELLRQLKEFQLSPVSTENTNTNILNHNSRSSSNNEQMYVLDQRQHPQQQTLQPNLNGRSFYSTGALSLYRSLTQEEDKSDEIDTSIHGKFILLYI
jgi:hypothetical protein